MSFLNLDGLSLGVISVIFVAASAIVWFAGTRLSRYTNALAKKTGTADVVLGGLLLGGITSLPEVVTTITASAAGDAGIAVNNLFGGVSLQVTILAFGDVIIRQRSITSLAASPVVELQGLVGIILIATAACVVLTGDAPIAHIGLGSVLIFVFFFCGFFMISYFKSIHWWKSDPEVRDNITRVKEVAGSQVAAREEKEEKQEESEKRRSFTSMLKTQLFLFLVLSALAVLVAGYTVVKSGQAFSNKTGIGSSLVGAIFIALSTSLPELSTTVSSVRMQEYRLAFSNIFGTNIFTIAFVFLADLFFLEGPILNEVSNFSLFAAMLAVTLTSIYLIGLIVRLKKTLFNLGYDSMLVLLCYFSGVVIMFTVLNS